METFQNLPVMLLDSPEAWGAWLEAHHASSPGVWLRLRKKDGQIPAPSYAEALDEALCWGWIDSTKRAYDADTFMQRFSPRKARSIWSQINREHVARLEAAGRMRPTGAACVAEAKADGRWAAAYAGGRDMQVPPELAAALDASPAAKARFETLDRTNRYAFLFRVQTAVKPETKAKRVAWAIDMLERGEMPHPSRKDAKSSDNEPAS